MLLLEKMKISYNDWKILKTVFHHNSTYNPNSQPKIMSQKGWQFSILKIHDLLWNKLKTDLYDSNRKLTGGTYHSVQQIISIFIITLELFVFKNNKISKASFIWFVGVRHNHKACSHRNQSYDSPVVEDFLFEKVACKVLYTRW
jgi:hypothetical protein